MAKYLNIDTDNQTDQFTKVIIESVVYMVRLRFNYRSGWQMSFYDYDLFDENADDNEDALLYGESKLMPSQNFFKYTNGSESLPTGYLFLYDTNQPDAQEYEYPTRYNLGSGKRFRLVYFTKEQFETFAAGG